MTVKDVNHVSWENAKELEDNIISFLLYQEGKPIDLISRIRNVSIDAIKDHIIQAKIKLGKKDNVTYAPIFTQLLASTKDERVDFLIHLTEDETSKLKSYIKRIMHQIDQPEDKMVAIWLAGHLKAAELLPEIRREYLHKHGGVRRMVCSALRKIPHNENLPVLHKALQDNKPQVRQYAAKALADIGDSITVGRLKNLLNKPGEMDYVKGAYKQAIQQIEERLKE